MSVRSTWGNQAVVCSALTPQGGRSLKASNNPPDDTEAATSAGSAASASSFIPPAMSMALLVSSRGNNSRFDHVAKRVSRHFVPRPGVAARLCIAAAEHIGSSDFEGVWVIPDPGSGSVGQVHKHWGTESVKLLPGHTRLHTCSSSAAGEARDVRPSKRASSGPASTSSWTITSKHEGFAQLVSAKMCSETHEEGPHSVIWAIEDPSVRLVRDVVQGSSRRPGWSVRRRASVVDRPPRRAHLLCSDV